MLSNPVVWAASRECVQRYFEYSDGSCLEVTFLENGTLKFIFGRNRE